MKNNTSNEDSDVLNYVLCIATRMRSFASNVCLFKALHIVKTSWGFVASVVVPRTRSLVEPGRLVVSCMLD